MWNYELAKKLEGKIQKAKDGAVNQSSFFIGKIESTSPLVITAFDGEGRYEEEDLILTRTFKTYFDSQKSKLKGKEVLAIPFSDSVSVVIVDVIGG